MLETRLRVGQTMKEDTKRRRGRKYITGTVLKCTMKVIKVVLQGSQSSDVVDFLGKDSKETRGFSKAGQRLSQCRSALTSLPGCACGW